MKITVITGSAHKHGSSALLADEFKKGAQESGHAMHCWTVDDIRQTDYPRQAYELGKSLK